MGAQVDYTNTNGPTVDVTLDGANVTVNSDNLDITDSNVDGVSVGNLVLTKDGDNTKVIGQVKISGSLDLPVSNQLGAGLTFYNNNGDKIGSVAVSGQYEQGVHTFEATGTGDFTNYSTVKLNVGNLNGLTQVGPPVAVDQTITLTKEATMYE